MCLYAHQFEGENCDYGIDLIIMDTLNRGYNREKNLSIKDEL